MASDLAQQLSEALDNAPQEPAAPQEVPVEPAPSAAVETADTDRPGRTAGRQRDESGRLLPGKAVREEPAPAAAAPVAPVVEGIEPPKSWKREYWDAYKTLPPNLAKYIREREEQYTSGIATHRNAAESAREIHNALAPYENDFKMAGVTAVQGVAKLAETHRAIRSATPEARIAIFQKLAQEYGVPIQNIVSGAVDPVQQYLTPLQHQIEELRSQQNSWVEQQKTYEQTAMQTEIEAFAAQHEHFDQVRPVMAQLLSSGIAADLKSAYEKAVRMDESLAVSPAPAQRSSPAAIQRARATAVSPKSATPAGTVVASGKKDVRSILEDTVEQFLGGGARV